MAVVCCFGLGLCGIGMWGGNLLCLVSLHVCCLNMYMHGPCTRRCTGWRRGIVEEGGRGPCCSSGSPCSSPIDHLGLPDPIPNPYLG